MVVRKDDLQMKILLVEDDKTIASDWNIQLRQDRFSTVLCYDVESAKSAH